MPPGSLKGDASWVAVVNLGSPTPKDMIIRALHGKEHGQFVLLWVGNLYLDWAYIPLFPTHHQLDLIMWVWRLTPQTPHHRTSASAIPKP